MSEFPETRWNLVLAASDRSARGSREALASLIEGYWYPVYAYIRRQGHDPEAAADLTQGFFARIMEKDVLQGIEEGRGRFRSYLLATLGHFLANERDRAQALKRGGATRLVSFHADEAGRRYDLEPTDDRTPERVFDRQWALETFERAIVRLRADLEGGGRSEVFEALQPFLIAGRDRVPYRDLAARLGVAESTVKVSVHRIRKRFREAVRREIAETVSDPSLVDDEIRDLFESLAE